MHFTEHKKEFAARLAALAGPGLRKCGCRRRRRAEHGGVQKLDAWKTAAKVSSLR